MYTAKVPLNQYVNATRRDSTCATFFLSVEDCYRTFALLWRIIYQLFTNAQFLPWDIQYCLIYILVRKHAYRFIGKCIRQALTIRIHVSWIETYFYVVHFLALCSNEMTHVCWTYHYKQSTATGKSIHHQYHFITVLSIQVPTRIATQWQRKESKRPGVANQSCTVHNCTLSDIDLVQLNPFYVVLRLFRTGFCTFEVTLATSNQLTRYQSCPSKLTTLSGRSIQFFSLDIPGIRSLVGVLHSVRKSFSMSAGDL